MIITGRSAIRILTGFLLIVLLGGLAGTAVYRALKKRPSETEMDADHVMNGGIGTAVEHFTGFQYVERVKGQLIFALEALQTLGLSSGWHDVEGVSVQLYNDDETKGPRLTCRKASFNVDSKNARLNGSVQVEFPDGSFLSTEIGMLQSGGRRFETGASVTFVGQDLLGRAGEARYELVDEVLELGGGVVIQTDDGGSLVAPTIVYRRNSQTVIMPEGGEVTFGSSSLKAPYFEILLDEDGGVPEAFTFRDGVEVTGMDSGSGQVIRMSTYRLRCERDASDRWHLEATSRGPWVRTSIVGGTSAIYQELTAWSIRAVAQGDVLLNLRADGRVCIETVPYDGPTRTANAHEMTLWFDQGQAGDLELRREVEVVDEAVTAKAHRARVDSAAHKIMLQGNPTGRKRVSIESERGRLTADQAVYSQTTGEVNVRGRVQGELFDAELVGNVEGGEGASDSVHVASDSLSVAPEGSNYHLSGSARAWQGQRLLVGDEIDYRPAEQRLDASGHTRTTFPAVMLDPEADPDQDVVLEARQMSFNEAERRAVYRGGVMYTDPRHSMAASELEINFEEDNRVERVVATGSVEIKAFETGQVLTGSRAERDISTMMVILTGEPAQATDQGGNMLSGQSLTWDQAGDRVLVSEDTETIFHPEEEP